MRLSGASAQEVSNHVSQLRNIVDLCSRAPANARRLSSARPIDYLSSVERLLAAEWVGIGSEVFVSSRYCSPLLTPQRLRHKALQLGFVTEDPKAPAVQARALQRALPRFRPSRGSPAWTWKATPRTRLRFWDPGGQSTQTRSLRRWIATLSPRAPLPGRTGHVQTSSAFQA